MEKLKKALDDSWQSVKPTTHVRAGTGTGGRTATGRDGSNVAVSGALVVVAVWILREVGVTIPPEIAVAFGTIVGYFVGRVFRY